MKHEHTPGTVVRLNRFLSMCGVTSRRKADDLIQAGEVRVNRAVVTDLGTKVRLSVDHVSVRGHEVAPSQEYVYLVLNKPKDTITTLSDERGRNTVMQLVSSRHRIYPIGRLDRHTTGVLLFTNDGPFAHQLMHPRHEIPKSYHVTLETPLQPSHRARLAKGIELEDGRTAPAEVIVLPQGKGKEIGIVIHEGRNRQVRRMFEHFGYSVRKLDRVAYGPITKSGLPRGESRALTKSEVRSLKELAGMDDVLA
ncbi:MAG TPA: pseudouridine synthase [Bacteroidota bacterium]|nr:pseudouridine synthase [Bacteroidota bacterium]